MLSMAAQLATLATCDKLKVGCILTDARGRVLSAGYNGPAQGRPHCEGYMKFSLNEACASFCQATHAESNALLSCYAPMSVVHTCYTTWSPCMACCKQLVQTGCRRIVFLFESDEVEHSRRFWMMRAAIEGREWVRHTAETAV